MASFSMSATATDLNQQQQQQQHPPLSSSSTTTAATITNESNTLRNDNNSSTSNNDNDLGQNHQGVIRYGKCKWFNVEKGWGFITPLDGGTEVFVHQSVIQMTGFRSLGEQEEVEFECKLTERGLEATRVSGHLGIDCHGSTYRPRTKKRFVRRVRCYNCGEFANHIAADCSMGPQPKRCHHCRQLDHLFVDCPQRHEEERQQSLQPHRRAPVGQQQQQQRQLPQLPDTVQFS